MSKPVIATRREFLGAAATGLALSPMVPTLAKASVRPGGASPSASMVSDLPDQAIGRPDPRSLQLPEKVPAWSGAKGKRLGLAVVGLGQFSLNQIMPRLPLTERCRLTAVVSGNAEKAAKVAKAYGLPDGAIYSYETFDQIAEDDTVDAVYIALPVGLHAEWTIRAFAAGKHVICEKPMEVSAEACERMIAAGKAADKKLMIAYRAHFEPLNLRAIEMLREGAIGTPRSIIASNHRILNLDAPEDVWRAAMSLAGGGALPDYGIYGMNAAYYLTGEMPVEIYASVDTPEDDPRFVEIEDHVTAQFTFPSGITAVITTSYSATGINDIQVQGTEGAIRMDPATFYGGNSLVLRRGYQNDPPLTGDSEKQFTGEFDHFASAVLEGTDIRTPGEMGLRDVRAIEAIYRSAREGRPIAMSPDGTMKD